MRRARRTTPPLLVAGGLTLLAAALLSGCGGAAVPSAEEVPIPRPDLAGFEPAVRRQVEAAQERAARLRDRAGGEATDREAAAEAYGDLGRLYHSFLFLGAAETCYLGAARLAAEDYEWPYLAATVQALQGKAAEAATSFEAARKLAPDDLMTLIRLGDLYLKLDRAADAREVFAHAVEVAPDSAAALFGLGRAAAAGGAPAEARDLFERALEVQPAATAIHYPLAQAYRALGEEEEFAAHLALRGERGVDVPDVLIQKVKLVEVRTGIESVLSLAAQPERLSDEELVNFAAAQFNGLGGAVDELARAVAGRDVGEGRVRARVFLVLGTLEAREGDPAEAVANLTEALRLAPDLDLARLPLAVSLARSGKPSAALEAIDGILDRHPEDAAARLARATVLEDLGRPDEALGELRRAAALAPEDGTARLRLATALEKRGELAAAARELQQAAELDMPQEDRGVAYHRLGEILRRLGRGAEARESYREALLLDPALTDARLGIAATLGQEGRYDEALKAYAEVLAERPKSETARVGKATVLLLLGRNGQAREELEAGLAAVPDSLPLARLLARHLAACPDRTVRDGARALELASRLMRSEPIFENAETLAMALAEAGRFADAAGAQEDLLRRARSVGRQADLPRLAANLERYRRGESCCAGGS